MVVDEPSTLETLRSEHLVAVARAAGEPAWLVEQRMQAWECFIQAPFPPWPRTKIRGISLDSLVPHFTPQGTEVHWERSGGAKGVIFTDLSTAVRKHEGVVRHYLGRAIAYWSHKFRALPAALWQDGVLLYVPPHTTTDVPFRVTYRLPAGSQVMLPYSLVVLEPGASVTFIETFTSADADPTALAAPTTEMILGEGSTVRYVCLQEWGAKVVHIGSQVQVLSQDAQSEWISLALGGQLQQIEAEARLQGNRSRIRWYGATLAHRDQHLSTTPLIRHIGVHTQSYLEFRTVVTDRATSVFDGMVELTKSSRDTTTRLEEHAIHLSTEARSEAVPGLKIDTNEVTSAGHACTCGQVSEEQIFYLQTRGIPRAEARRVIVLGFFEPVLQILADEALRASLEHALQDHV